MNIQATWLPFYKMLFCFFFFRNPTMKSRRIWHTIGELGLGQK